MLCSARHWLVITWVVAACLWWQNAHAAQEEKASEEVLRLTKLLASPDAKVRLASVALLGDLADAARTRQIRDPSDSPLPALRETAAPELIKLAEDPNPAVRRMAVLAIGKIRAPGDEASKVWLRALQDPDAAVRRVVPEALLAYFSRALEIGAAPSTPAHLIPGQQFYEDIAAVAKPVQACLRSGDNEVTNKTLRALDVLLDTVERTPDLRPGDQPLITEAATAPYRQAILKAAEALRSFLQPAVAVLQQPPTSNQRLAANFIEDLARLCDPRPDILDRKEEGKRLRGRMVRTDIGTEGVDALKLLKDGLREALPTLIELATQPPVCVQLVVLDALEVYGPEAAPAVPAVRLELRNHDRFVRWAAARTLAKIGPAENNLPTVLGLAELVRDDDLDVATSACDFLAESFAQDAGPAVPALAWAAQSQERELQYAAVHALASVVSAIKAEARAAVPGLIVALKSSDLKTRQATPPILGQLGPEAEAALPALQEALSDSDLEVRQSAAKAILRIRGQ
jgi:HEAT repeat protein